MRKLFLFVCLFAFTLVGKAQISGLLGKSVLPAQSDLKNEYSKSDTTHSAEQTTLNASGGGFSTEIDYLAIKDYGSYRMSLLINHIIIDGGMGFGKTTDDLRTNDNWWVGLGYNYRYHLNKNFYIDGRAICDYVTGTLESVTGKETHTYTSGMLAGRTYETKIWSKKTDGDFSLRISPKVGVRLCKFLGSDLHLVGGYEWYFRKFKTDKGCKFDYFTLGISLLQ